MRKTIYGLMAALAITSSAYAQKKVVNHVPRPNPEISEVEPYTLEDREFVFLMVPKSLFEKGNSFEVYYNGKIHSKWEMSFEELQSALEDNVFDDHAVYYWSKDRLDVLKIPEEFKIVGFKDKAIVWDFHVYVYRDASYESERL